MVCKAITSYVRRSDNHYAFYNSCIILELFYYSFFSCVPYGSVTSVFIGLDCLHSFNNSFQPWPPFYNYYFLCAVHKKTKKKCFYKIWGGIRVNNINQGPKIFSYEKNACAEVRRHSDIYFRCSGGFWFMSKFLVVFCSRSCHGSSSRISETLLYPIQKVLFVLFFIKVLEVRVKESETNQIPRGRLHLNQVLSILF